MDSPIFVTADMEVNFALLTLPKIVAYLDPHIRTVIIAECSMMYLQDSAVKDILVSLSATFKSAHLIIFEPLYLGDPFGKIMEKNLSERGLPTESFMMYPSIESYKTRIQTFGWSKVVLSNMAELSRNTTFTTLYLTSISHAIFIV